jgi:hypothetical protein
VGFDIFGTDPEPKLPVDQGKPRMHLTLPWVLQNLYHLYLWIIALSVKSWVIS